MTSFPVCRQLQGGRGENERGELHGELGGGVDVEDTCWLAGDRWAVGVGVRSESIAGLVRGYRITHMAIACSLLFS